MMEEKYPACNTNTTHDTTHLFTCPAVPTGLVVGDLWESPAEVVALLGRWARIIGWDGWT